MDINHYIETGVLDNYVLGSISERDKRAVECLSKIYPEINEELRKIQRSIEAFAKAGAVQPPKGLKTKILKEIESIAFLPNHVQDNENSNITSLKVTYKKEKTPKIYQFWSITELILKC